MEKEVSISDRKKIGSYVVPMAYSCNNNCRFCYNKGGRMISPQLGLEEIKKEIKLAKTKGYRAVALFGGECTIQPNFFKVLDFTKQLGLKIRLETNGRMFAYKDFVKKITKYDFDSCQISLHAHTAQIHDYLTRTPGSFNQTIQGINNLRVYFPNLPIETYTVITTKNYQYLPAIAEFISNNTDAKCLYFSF